MLNHKLYIVKSEARLQEINRRMEILNERNIVLQKKLERFIKEANKITNADQPEYVQIDK